MGTCAELFCKPPVHKKVHSGVLFIAKNLVFNFTDAHLSSFLNFSIFCVRPCFGLNVRVRRILQLRTSSFGHGGLSYSSCMPRYSCLHVSSIQCQSTQELCLRPPFQGDVGTNGEPCRVCTQRISTSSYQKKQ